MEKRIKKASATILLVAALALGMLAGPASSVAFNGHGCSIRTCKYFTSSYSTAIYFYNRHTCDQWKGLSRTYLNGFKTKRKLKRHFDRRLHAPC